MKKESEDAIVCSVVLEYCVQLRSACVYTHVSGEWSGREVNLAAVTEAQHSEVEREGTGREQRHFCPEPWISSGGQNTTGLGIHTGWNHHAGDRKPWVTG